MATKGMFPSLNSVAPSKIGGGTIIQTPPDNNPSSAIPWEPLAKLVPREAFFELIETLPRGTVLFPGCKAYEQAIFIGNLLFFKLTPSAVVQAVIEEDVTTTVSFAAKKGIKLTVKSGGHSMGGYCLNDGGIVLDISSMNDVKIDKRSCVASIQGGAVWNDIYRRLHMTNLVAVGGNCPSVGVSAFLLGGGVSPYSRKYGLGIDNLLEMTIVTADGKKVTVNGKEDDERLRDLFWAVRGGGGGNFGITVNVKLQLRTMVDKHGTVVSGNLTWKLDPGSKQEKEFKSMMEVWNNTAWPAELRGDALWHYDEKSKLLGKMTIVYNGDLEACNKAIAPLLKFHPENGLKSMHWTEWEAIDGKIDVFQKQYHHHASFIFGEGGITHQVTDIITGLIREKLITQNEDIDGYILWHHMGCATTKIKPQDTAFFWRDGYYVFHLKVIWSDPRFKDDISLFFDDCKRKLNGYALGEKAAYVNFMDPTVVNWTKAYYGDNYHRLRHVKADWDPTGFFNFPRGIRGSHSASNQNEPVEEKSSWSKYALPTPELKGNPRTVDEIFSNDACVRRKALGIM